MNLFSWLSLGTGDVLVALVMGVTLLACVCVVVLIVAFMRSGIGYPIPTFPSPKPPSNDDPRTFW